MKKSYYEWIPVQEYLPKSGGYYLVTHKAEYSVANFVTVSSYLNGRFEVKNVIAWRDLPLPYPYK